MITCIYSNIDDFNKMLKIYYMKLMNAMLK